MSIVSLIYKIQYFWFLVFETIAKDYLNCESKVKIRSRLWTTKMNCIYYSFSKREGPPSSLWPKNEILKQKKKSNSSKVSIILSNNYALWKAIVVCSGAKQDFNTMQME